MRLLCSFPSLLLRTVPGQKLAQWDFFEQPKCDEIAMGITRFSGGDLPRPLAWATRTGLSDPNTIRPVGPVHAAQASGLGTRDPEKLAKPRSCQHLKQSWNREPHEECRDTRCRFFATCNPCFRNNPQFRYAYRLTSLSGLVTVGITLEFTTSAR